MSEEEKVLQQIEEQDQNVAVYSDIPYGIINSELGDESNSFQQEMNEIVSLYAAYRKGVAFLTEGSNGDYIPSKLRYKKAASLINKEARFLFANPPTFNVNINDVKTDKEDDNTILQDFLDAVLEKNSFNRKLLQAAKDCFIGKRIAIVMNFNEQSGISITFLKATEFIYEKKSSSSNELKRFVAFSNSINTTTRTKQRWFKKSYIAENDGVYVQEEVYDGLGVLVKEVLPRKKIALKHIPAVVVINDGLLGDVQGESEMSGLMDYEGVYSKLANADIDAGRKNMNPVRYIADASEQSTQGLSLAPGALWDLQSDEDKSEIRTLQVGLLESNMSYSPALKTTLDRVENAMHEELDIPNTTSEKLQGVITSGKTLKALYWGLIVRCDEKMLAWGDALKFVAETIIEGAKLYPNCARSYLSETKIPSITYKILVENNYPLPEDEYEEKTSDLAEIETKTMSRKAYLKKWRKLSDEEAEEELNQIKRENDLFENSILPLTQ